MSQLTSGVLIGVLMLIFLAPSGRAQVVELKLKHEKKGTHKVVINKKMADLKEFENSKRWKECSNLAAQVFEQQVSVRGWVMTTWLNCARQGAKEAKSLSLLQLPLAKFEKAQNLIFESPARKVLKEELWKARGAVIEEAIKGNTKLEHIYVDRQIQGLWDLGVDKEQKAKLLAWSGELALARHQQMAAEVFLQQSVDLVDSRPVRDKLSSVQLALNRKKAEDSVGQQSLDRPVDRANEKGSDIALEKGSKGETLSEGETRFEERFKTSLKNNDLIAFVEDGIAYINQFPNGHRTKWATDKVLDIYQSFVDRSNYKLSEKAELRANGKVNGQVNGQSNGQTNVKSPDKSAELPVDSIDEKFASLRVNVLQQFEKLEPTRAHEFARILHRKNDFIASLRLAERALVGLSQSAHAAQLHYIAGRSAQFLGSYSKARIHFENYLEFHSSAEDFGEVSFRLALVHLREAHYSSAIAVLEKLLFSKAGDKFELGSRYWLVRALQATHNERAQGEIAKILEKFPFSYYGLRLKSEKQDLQLEPLPALAQAGKMSEVALMTGFQKQTWDRALFLGSHGWVAEAFTEISEMTFTNSARVKILLAEALAQNGIYWTAIRLTNEAVDSDVQLRSSDVLNLAFPSAYEKAIQTQADKYHLSPWLVKSLIRQESAYNERATSVSRAMGLMQLIPPTAQEVATELGLVGLDLPEDSYLPEINLQMGTYYIARMIKQFGGNVPMGLAAYNAGPTKMQAFIKARPEVELNLTRFSSEPQDEIWMDELPWSETSFYVKAILRNSILYRLLVLSEGAPALKLEKIVWQDLAPELRPQTRLDVRPVSRPVSTH